MTRAPAVLLGFDYGTERIGVAVGQSVTRSARPLEVVRVCHNKPDWEAVSRLMATWQPTKLVVGLPYHLDGSDQEMTHAARRFGRQLHGRYRLPVDMVDERLTTMAACSRLRERGEDTSVLDPVAAQLILEGWFTEHPDA